MPILYGIYCNVRTRAPVLIHGNSAKLSLPWACSNINVFKEMVNSIVSMFTCVKQIVHIERDRKIYHYDDVIMTMLASQITSLTVIYSIVYSGVNQRKHQSSASLAFVREIHRGPVNFPHKWPVTRKMFPFDDVIMCQRHCLHFWY